MTDQDHHLNSKHLQRELCAELIKITHADVERIEFKWYKTKTGVGYCLVDNHESIKQTPLTNFVHQLAQDHIGLLNTMSGTWSAAMLTLTESDGSWKSSLSLS